MVISIIIFGVLCYGAEKSRQAANSRERLVRPMELIPLDPLPDGVAPAHGAIRSSLDRRGNPVGANDLRITVHALARDPIMVSSHTCEFTRVDGLSTEKWGK